MKTKDMVEVHPAHDGVVHYMYVKELLENKEFRKGIREITSYPKMVTLPDGNVELREDPLLS